MCPASGKIKRFSVYREGDIAKRQQVEAGRGDDDIGIEMIAGCQSDACFGEILDVIGDDGGLAGRDAFEQVTVGQGGQPLPPRTVVRDEMRIHRIVRPEIGSCTPRAVRRAAPPALRRNGG